MSQGPEGARELEGMPDEGNQVSRSPDPRVAAPPGLEVVIPAWQGERFLDQCIEGLLQAGIDPTRIVVVDDASQDGTAAVGESRGVRTIRHVSRRGAAAARNTGVAACSADLILFVDADVVVHADIVSWLGQPFAEPDLAAVFGSYDAEPTARGLVSQYRNLLHHFVHQQAAAEATTFWTGCGVIRRDVFLAIGGFDPSLDFMEDIDLGARVRAGGWRIRLEPQLLCTHLKRWTLAGMVRADLFHRAIPWSRLLLSRRSPLPDDLNVSQRQRQAVALTGVLAGALVLMPVWSGAVWLMLAAAAGILGINLRFFAFLARIRGPGFAAAAFPVHVIHHGCAGCGFALAALEHGAARALAPFRGAPRRPAGLEITQAGRDARSRSGGGRAG